MDLHTYLALRRGLQSSSVPAGQGQLLQVERSLVDTLSTSGVFFDVEVDHTDDPNNLVVAMCRYSEDIQPELVAARLQGLWQARVSYDFWQVHTTRVDADQIELRGASKRDPHSEYVTLHLIAQGAPIPAQRRPLD